MQFIYVVDYIMCPLLRETISEIYRILKPGGYFYFIEPNKDTWVNQFSKFGTKWIINL